MTSPVAKSKQIADRLHSLAENARQGVTLSRSDTTGKALKDWDNHPAKYFEADPRDEVMETRKIIAEDIRSKSKSAFGTSLPITDAEIQYIISQKTKTEKLDFDRWKYGTYTPGADPAKLKFFESIDPGFFQEREQQIDKDLEFVKRLAILTLRGVENEDDVLLLYGISTGQIQVPNWKAHFPDLYDDDLKTPSSISDGYWNPRRYTSDYEHPPRVQNVYGDKRVAFNFENLSKPTAGASIAKFKSVAFK